VFLIDQDDNKVGPTSTAECLRRARELGLDLVEVAPNARPPVCKIMDYGKWRYQQQKKADKSRASVRGGRRWSVPQRLWSSMPGRLRWRVPTPDPRPLPPCWSATRTSHSSSPTWA